MWKDYMFLLTTELVSGIQPKPIKKKQNNKTTFDFEMRKHHWRKTAYLFTGFATRETKYWTEILT